MEKFQRQVYDIELDIVLDYFTRNRKFMEEQRCLNTMNIKYVGIIYIIPLIREFIKENYKEMYMKWAEKSDNGFYGE